MQIYLQFSEREYFRGKDYLYCLYPIHYYARAYNGESEKDVTLLTLLTPKDWSRRVRRVTLKTDKTIYIQSCS